MGLFRRKGEANIRAQRLLGDEVVGVPADEAEGYIEQMHAEIVDTYPGESTEEERLTYQVGVLSLVGDPSRPAKIPSETFALGQSVARMGYLTREYEVERFGPFEEDGPGLVDLLDSLAQGADTENVAAVCFALAQAEPNEPAPDEASLLWMIQGTGGHVRNRLAFYTIYGVTPEQGLPDGLSSDGLRTLWRFGFLYRCATEALAQRGPTEQETREAAERLGWRPETEEE